MVNEELIKNHFAFLRNDILGLLLFGSQVKNNPTRGDIDICVVVGKNGYRDDMDFYIRRNVNFQKYKYDICIFEELQLYMKIQVINNHKVIFAKSEVELYEYFYFFRKLWKGQEYRQKVDLQEILR